MSDKPLPQENLATKISNLVHSFDQFDVSFQFFAAFLKTMANEWNGIDQWRIDKFMMLVRRVTREMIHIIQQNNYSDEVIERLDETLKKTVLGSDHVPRGLFMHFTELFFEEVAKVSNGEIEPEHVTKLLQPFMFYVASQGDYKLIQFVVRQVFNHLLFQSESGREYKEKFDAWKSVSTHFNLQFKEFVMNFEIICTDEFPGKINQRTGSRRTGWRRERRKWRGDGKWWRREWR